MDKEERIRQIDAQIRQYLDNYNIHSTVISDAELGKLELAANDSEVTRIINERRILVTEACNKNLFY